MASSDAASVVAAVFQGARRAPPGFVAHYNNNPGVNSTHQADVLFLPKDPRTRRAYALVVSDLATRRIAARALTTKTAAAVATALQDIYTNDPVLRPPRRFEADDGGEFKGATKKYLEEQGVFIRYGEPGRHRQQGAAEGMNRILGRAIMIAQAKRELETGKPNREWVRELPDFVAAINERLERKPPALPQTIPPPSSSMERNLLPEGTFVRRILNHPRDVLGKKLSPSRTSTGRRAGDPTYEVQKRAVTALVLRPGISPRYVLQGLPHVSYGRHELILA